MLRRAASSMMAAAAASLPVVAHAHIAPAGTAAEATFATGVLHPLTGADHVVAMIAVGLWGAQLGPPAMWSLPITFPLVMAIGGIAGVVGVPLPAVELGVAMSAVVLGLMVACELRPPLWMAMLVVGVFAVFHGHAHGAALPSFGVPILYAAGFVTTTGLLHFFGIAIGLLTWWPFGKVVVRAAGVAVALVGVTFAVRLW